MAQIANAEVIEQSVQENEASPSAVIPFNTIKTKQGYGYRFVKRAFDIVCSLIALIILFIPMAIVALCIYIDDPQGPPLFVQMRTGKDGKPFRFYKFRSMIVNAPELHDSLLDQNEMDGPVFKIKDDPRITRVGKFIRKTSIDELPQLLNILKGEMSVVGPRPLPVYETEPMSPHQFARHEVRPGLLCYWQISGRNEISFDEWMEMDRKYIRDANVWTDLKIIFKAVPAVLSHRGAE